MVKSYFHQSNLSFKIILLFISQTANTYDAYSIFFIGPFLHYCTASYLSLWVVLSAAPVSIRTVTHRCNFPHHPPPPQVSRCVWCSQWWNFSIQPAHTPGRRHQQNRFSHTVYRGHTVAIATLNLFVCVSYLIPGHLWLFVWSHIVFYIRTGDHFAVGYLSFLQMADFAAEAFPLITLLHRHRHGHFHAVCWVPKQIKNTTSGKCC